VAYGLLRLMGSFFSHDGEKVKMEVLTLLIAVIALVIGSIAFQRTGGIKELKRQVEAVNLKSESVRDRTADVLERLERAVRGKGKGAPKDVQGPLV